VLRDFWITGDEQEIETVRGPPRPQSATTVTPLDSKRHPLTGQRANVRGQSDARLIRYQAQNVFVVFKPWEIFNKKNEYTLPYKFREI
jgi:hypothetical protein